MRSKLHQLLTDLEVCLREVIDLKMKWDKGLVPTMADVERMALLHARMNRYLTELLNLVAWGE